MVQLTTLTCVILGFSKGGLPRGPSTVGADKFDRHFLKT